jgi:hypothetical protein
MAAPIKPPAGRLSIRLEPVALPMADFGTCFGAVWNYLSRQSRIGLAFKTK